MKSIRARDEFWTDDVDARSGPWLGHDFPGQEPVELRPDILATGRHSFCTVFGPQGDEFYFATADPDPEKDMAHLAWMKMNEDGSWTLPVVAPFNSEWNDNDLCMAPDGSRIAWRSWRPLPGQSKPQERSALWIVDRKSEGWSEPRPVTCDGEVTYGGYPGISRSGTIYFAGRRSPRECCVYRARRNGEQYEAAVPILGDMQFGGDMCIAPDERFLIIACWEVPTNRGEGDLYISFRMQDGSWAPLQNLGDPINTEIIENCPMLSPNGRQFLFFRYDRATKAAHSYWVDASVLERLRPKQ